MEKWARKGDTVGQRCGQNGNENETPLEGAVGEMVEKMTHHRAINYARLARQSLGR